MVDSGATGLFMNERFAKENGLVRRQLKKPLQVFNIDGTLNHSGSIREFAPMAITVDGHKHWVDFLITDLGKENLILGLPWLRRVNPEVDWAKGLLSIKMHQVTIEEVPDREGEAGGGTTIGGGILEDTRDNSEMVTVTGEKTGEELTEPVLEDGDKLPQICVDAL